MADIFSKNQYDLKVAARKSKDWFQQQALLLGKQNITPQRVLKEKPDHSKAGIIPGHMYMFLYDAKHKDTLQYWDRFPLVFPYKKTAKGFIGLNMHYLPYQMRIILLDRLMQFKNNDRMDETTKLKYSWATIGGMTRFKAAEPCIHEYLIGHVKSSFKKIDANDWTTALLLPVELFVGANKNTAWSESRKRITSV